MPTTRPTYELRVHADPVSLPYGSSTLSRHRSYTTARRAWRYAERHARAPLPRVIVKCCVGAEAVIRTD